MVKSGIFVAKIWVQIFTRFGWRNKNNMANSRWKKRFYVDGTRPGSQYVVAQDSFGQWACSCPRWKFMREECKHIKAVRLGSEFMPNATSGELKQFTAFLKQEVR
jgi:hypothetical protein